MNESIAILILCFSFLYLLERIDISVHKKVNNAYKASHIVYPLFMVVGMIYFLVTGIID